MLWAGCEEALGSLAEGAWLVAVGGAPLDLGLDGGGASAWEQTGETTGPRRQESGDEQVK